MLCKQCQQPIDSTEATCPHCGAFITHESASASTASSSYVSVDSVPYEIKKWSWGACMFNAYWGIGNYTYWPLLCLIPGFNFIWMIVCGILGNEWAWKSGKFNSVEDFLAVQASWNKAGLICFIFTASLCAIILLIFILCLVLGILGA